FPTLTVSTQGIGGTWADDIVNAGTGVLDGLSVGAITYGAGAANWITSAKLDATTAPTRLAVTVSPGGLPVGTYTASIPVASSAGGVTNSPKALPVVLTVGAPAG